jgi:hypothetical protein
MIDSAMTPEPIVATVRFESGDMSASIGAVVARGGLVSRVIALPRRDRESRSGVAGRSYGATGPWTDESRSLREESDRLLVLVFARGGEGGAEANTGPELLTIPEAQVDIL